MIIVCQLSGLQDRDAGKVSIADVLVSVEKLHGKFNFQTIFATKEKSLLKMISSLPPI
jgi:hypothetical protein